VKYAERIDRVMTALIVARKGSSYVLHDHELERAYEDAERIVSTSDKRSAEKWRAEQAKREAVEAAPATEREPERAGVLGLIGTSEAIKARAPRRNAVPCTCHPEVYSRSCPVFEHSERAYTQADRAYEQALRLGAPRP